MNQEKSLSSAAASRDIAIVGMSCRYPGAVNSPEEFYSFLMNDGDGIVPVPADRWQNEAYYDKDRTKKNRIYVDQGGFLRNIDQFDPLFFGISPAEAATLDPQHRWLLELTYEAMEDAGIAPKDLRSSDTAVYIGQFMHDYEQLQLDSLAHEWMTPHTATGPSMTLTSNRISYTFDFKGPSVTLDTACSSSLVAVDLACKALLNGDSQLAVAGGVNILLRPELTMSICRASMLSPDCRCKSFDVSANGYVRSEGAGVILLKRVEDALRDGDRIYAVIKASGVNQDGQTVGITVPNGAAQAELIHKTLSRADLQGSDINYVEAHGTGTAVGDPIEVNALSAIVGKRADEAPECIIGSVKSNIGHTEAAAGVAGIIKTVMAMRHGTIPRNLHLNERNPAILLEGLRVRLADKPAPWPDSKGQRRRALVNSFGFGGTNANVVLEEAPARRFKDVSARSAAATQLKVLPLSAKSEEALKALASRYVKQLSAPPETLRNAASSLDNLCWSAGVRREHHKHRTVALGRDEQELCASLEAYLRGDPSVPHVHGSAPSEVANRIVFVYSGMGTQWARMGKTLFETEPVFRATLERCSRAIEKLAGWSLCECLYSLTDRSIAETYLAQPAIFSIQAALTELLATWGFVPHAVVGHSAGEVCAAYVAGALSFQDAIAVIYHRSRLQQTTEGTGKMLAVGVTLPAITPFLKGVEDRVSVAAINSDDAITLAGDAAALEQIATKLERDGAFARFLKVGVPYHSPVMDRLREPLIDALRGIEVRSPRIALYSTVSGALTAAGDWDPEYWTRNVRYPVLFQTAIQTILRDGYNGFVEVSPHSALASSIQKIMEGEKAKGFVASTLKRDQDDAVMLGQSVGSLYTQGLSPAWDALYPGCEYTNLPLYPWQRSSYWHEAPEVKRARLKNVSGQDAFSDPVHPLLGSKLDSDTPLWRKRLSLQDQSFLADHQVEGEPVYPAAAYIEAFLALATTSTESLRVVHDVEFKKALFLDRTKPTVFETTHSSPRARISAVDAQTGRWDVYSTARLGSPRTVATPVPLTIDHLKAALDEEMDRTSFYAHCEALGLTYRGVFQPVQKAWYGNTEALVEIVLDPSLSLDEFLLHPALLDGGFQAVFPLLQQGHLPVKIAAIRYYKKPSAHCFCLIRKTAQSDSEIRGDLSLIEEDGSVSVEMFGIELRSTKTDAAENTPLLHEFVWEPCEKTHVPSEKSADVRRRYLIIGDRGGLAARVEKELTSRGHHVSTVTLNRTAEGLTPGAVDADELTAEEVATRLKPFAAGLSALVYLGALDCQVSESFTGDEVQASTETVTVRALHLVQAIDSLEQKDPVPLVFATRAAQCVSAEDTAPDPAQGSLWGMVRVVESEFPAFRCTQVDLPSDVCDATVVLFADLVANPPEERELGLRRDGLFAHRLRATSEHQLSQQAHLANEPRGERAWGVVSHPAGTDGVAFVAQPSTPGGAASICAKVKAAAFRRSDLSALLKSSASHLCAVTGEMVRAKNTSNDSTTGVQVIGFTRSGLTSFSKMVPGCVVEIPPTWTGAQAVEIPGVFFPAYLALNYVGRLREGERVLLHNLPIDAAVAGLQLAKLKGATVYASTTGAEARSRLVDHGAAAVYDRDHYDWPERLRSATGNRGVDLVLNGDSEREGLRSANLLGPLGRFVDLTGDSPLSDSHRSISYHRFQVADFVDHQPTLCGQILAELTHLMVDALIRPIGLTLRNAMDLGAHLNSEEPPLQTIVASFEEAPTQIAPGLRDPIVRPNRTYLVTGGLGGVGLEVVQWLITQGATSIVPVGRSAPRAAAQALIDRATRGGAKVIPLQGDVANDADVVRILSQIAREFPPLAGVVHGAGVLDDGVVGQQSRARFARVLGPKVKGSWNLHRHTREMPLDWFVCFSSIASVLGWSGQSNYAAGNGFMDTLVHRRKRQGLSGTSINWGPWAEVGMAASLGSREQQRMRDAGLTPLTSQRALVSMEQLLRTHATQAGVFDVKWAKLAIALPIDSKRNLLQALLEKTSDAEATHIIDRLRAATEQERVQLLVATVADVVASVLGMNSSEGLDRERSVIDYGVNSLMAMDVRNRLQGVLGLKLPGTFALKYPTVDAMVRYIAENLDTRSSGDSLYWSPEAPDVVHGHEVNGPLPSLTPSVLNWIHEGHTSHFNVGSLLEGDAGEFDLKAFKTALHILVEHHDGCRNSIYVENGTYHSEIIPLGNRLEVTEHDLSHLHYSEGSAQMMAINNRLHRSFRFERGEFLFRFAYYKLKHETPHRVFIVFHHYVSDALSQKIFGHALFDIYRKIVAKQPVLLPPKTFTLIDWVKRLDAFAHSEAEHQLPDWLAKVERSRASFVRDEFVSNRERRLEDYVLYTESRSRDEYTQLVDFCRQQRFELEDFCIYGLIKAFARITGSESLWVEIVIHARSGVFPDVAIPDLFGQISESAAVLFELLPRGTLKEQLEVIRRQRTEVQNGGLGWRALRFLNRNPRVRNLLVNDESPQIGLNLDLTDYAGQAEQSGFRFAREGVGEKQTPHVRKKADELRLAFFICPRVRFGSFSLEIGYYRDRFYERTIEKLTRDFFAILRSSALPTPPDQMPDKETVPATLWRPTENREEPEASSVAS